MAHSPASAASGVHPVHPVHPVHSPGGLPAGGPPEPDSSSSSTSLLAGILSRTRALQALSSSPPPAQSPCPASASATATATPVTPAPTGDQTARLTANGWPPRAVHTLPRMTGPALAKAQAVLPLLLGDGILILMGPTGRGKTVMAAWWAWRRLAAGRSCGRLLTAYQLFARMKQCWTRGEDADAVLRGWRTTPFLAIDELQSRAGSDWENSVLDELINARYAARLPTVLLGNLEPGREQEALGPRILDRARECGGVIQCGWGSYRG